MRQRYGSFTIILIVLICIGVLTRLMAHPGAFVIPAIVLGIVFLLYKIPPHRWRKKYEYNHRTQRKSRLKVIHGRKRDDDDPKPPPYH